MTDVLSRHNGAAEPTERHSLSRRQLIKVGAWAAPVIVLATAAPAAAASIDVGGIDSLRITSANGQAQFGSNWGTSGESTFTLTFTNDDMRAQGQTATVTAVLYYLGPGAPASTTVFNAVTLAPHQDGGGNQIRWVVPGFAPAQANRFYFALTAPGFQTVTSNEFTINMP